MFTKFAIGLMFRFEAVKDEKTQENKNHCREIIISGSDSDEIFIPFLNYDCNWSDQDRRYENESYIFEYAAENKDYNDYGNFVFKVPSVKSVCKYIKILMEFLFIEFKFDIVNFSLYLQLERIVFHLFI